MTTTEIYSFCQSLGAGLRHHDYPAGSIAARYAEGPVARSKAAQYVRDFRSAGNPLAAAIAKTITRTISRQILATR